MNCKKESGVIRYEGRVDYSEGLSIETIISFFVDGEATLMQNITSPHGSDSAEVEISWAQAQELVGETVGTDSFI